MMDRKYRVFVAVYRQPGLKEPLRCQLGLSFYHWAIWIEPKGAKDDTASYCFDTVVEEYSQTWQFRCDESAQAIRSTGLLLRVMVGKIPQRIKIIPDVFQLLHQIPPPNPEADCTEDSASWLAEALLVLQEHGLIEDFNIPDVMQNAALATDSLRNGYTNIGGKKVNAVGNRKFP